MVKHTVIQRALLFKKCNQLGIRTKEKDTIQQLSSYIRLKQNSTLLENFENDDIAPEKAQFNIVLNQLLTNTQLDKIYYICTKCNSHFTTLKHKSSMWKNNLICNKCWNSFNNDRLLLQQQIHNIIPLVCSFCKHSPTDNTNIHFHFDHINMFNKSYNICDMVNAGMDLQLILDEIQKCQLLCIQCHHCITKAEWEHYFIQYKININRQYKMKKINKQERDMLIHDIIPIYDAIMQPIYDEMKQGEGNIKKL